MNKIKLLLMIVLLSSIGLHAISFNGKVTGGTSIDYDLNIDEAQNVEFLIQHSVKPKGNSNYEIFIYEKLSEKKNGQQLLRFKPDVHNLEPIKFNLALSKGNYIINLRSNQYYDMPFDFKINAKTTGSFEQEPNNSFEEANKIDEKYFYTGYMARRDGIYPSDYYKLIMPEDGKMKIVFQTDNICHTKDNPKDCYVVLLYDGSLSEANHERINNPLIQYEPKQKEEERSIGLSKGEYYLRIYSKRLEKKDTNKPYRIAYLTAPSKYTELEPNDKSKNATALTAGKYYSAIIQEKYAEVDHFSFEVPQKQTVTVSFKLDNDKRFGRGISLYDENNKWIDDFSLNKQDSQKQFEAILDKGKYFLMVRYEEGTQYSIGVILPKADLVTQEPIKSSKKSGAEKSFLEKIEEQKKSLVK